MQIGDEVHALIGQVRDRLWCANCRHLANLAKPPQPNPRDRRALGDGSCLVCDLGHVALKLGRAQPRAPQAARLTVRSTAAETR